MSETLPNDATKNGGVRAWLAPLRLALARSPLMRLGGGRVERVERLPLEPWFPLVTPAPALAEDFYLGRYRLAGIRRERSYPPFDPDGFGGEPDAWGQALHGFGWLRPLFDEGTPLARANAQALVRDWIGLCGSDMRPPGWAPPVAARRLDAWLTHHAWLLEAAGDDFALLLGSSIARHIRVLRSSVGGLGAGVRAEVGCVLALAHAATGSGTRATSHIQGGLRDWAAGDGGPRSGDPREAARMLALLMRVQDARSAPLPALERAIERLQQWLGALRHADGRLAALHGTGHIPPRLLDAVLAEAGAASQRADRLEGPGGAVAILDGGERFSSAGALELSVPAGRMVVSCNVPEREGALRDALKAAAAHSTLDAAGAVSITKPVADGAVALRRGELEHERRLAFETEGLTGIDTVRGAGSATLRFHLHPAVTALREGPHAVSLAVSNPGGTARWTFHCVDAAVTLDETVVFAESAADFASGHGRPSTQITLDVPPGESEREVRWMFVRHS